MQAKSVCAKEIECRLWDDAIVSVFEQVLEGLAGTEL
jgi:hypothetical protein